MNLAQLKGLIANAGPTCPEPGCAEPFEDWPDANENDDKVMYVAPDALFAATCSNGHMIEFMLAELKVGEVEARTRTERTYGRRIAQKDCDHNWSRQTFFIPEGGQAPSMKGWVEGPVHMLFCKLCGGRQVTDNPEEKSGGRIVLP